LDRIYQMVYSDYKAGFIQLEINVNEDEIKYLKFDEQKGKLKVSKRYKVSDRNKMLEEFKNIYDDMYKRIKQYPYGYEIGVHNKKLHIHIFKELNNRNRIFEYIIEFKDKKHAEEEYQKINKILDKKKKRSN